MKQRILCILPTALLLFLCSCSPANPKNAVSSEIKGAFTGDSLVIKMEDFTDFTWDTLVVYQDPVSSEQISEAGGTDYQGSLDLLDGMIFIDDGQVVYEEAFPTDFETPHEFVIYPYAEGEPGKVNAFTPETAVFSGTRKNYDGRYDCYTFRPIGSQNFPDTAEAVSR